LAVALRQVLGAERVRDGEIDGLAADGREGVERRLGELDERRRAVVPVRVALQHGPGAQAAALAADALHETLALECADEPGRRALRQARAVRELSHGDRPSRLDDVYEQLRRAVDRLGAGLGCHLTMWNARSIGIEAARRGYVNHRPERPWLGSEP